MAVVAQAPIAAPSFAVVRRGYDPDQVTQHLNRVSAETTILAADRAAAVEQATQLSQQLEATRSELDAARAEIERLRGELRVLSGPPDSVASMNDRLQVMLRLARDEFGDMRATAAAQASQHAAEIIAAVGKEAGDGNGIQIDEAEWRGPQNEQEIERMRREAAEERARLDAAAAARRAEADEEFRQVLTLRCREAMAQLARLQTEALHTARRVIEDADGQAKSVLADAREAVRRTVEEAQREVDDLHSLRERLATQLDTSRKLLDRALPDPRTTLPVQPPAENGSGKNSVGKNSPGKNSAETDSPEQAVAQHAAPEGAAPQPENERAPDQTPRTIAGQPAHAERSAERSAPVTAEQRTPAHLAVVEAPADRPRHAAPQQEAPAPPPAQAMLQPPTPDPAPQSATASADSGGQQHVQPMAQPSVPDTAPPPAPPVAPPPAPPAPMHPAAPAETQPMAPPRAADTPADTQPGHAVAGEATRPLVDHPLYEAPRAQPMRFPPTDRNRQPEEKDAEPEASVPEPSKAPESETRAPHPYL